MDFTFYCVCCGQELYLSNIEKEGKNLTGNLTVECNNCRSQHKLSVSDTPCMINGEPRYEQFVVTAFPI